MEDLRRFGNDPSDEQWITLSKLLSCYSGIAFGAISGRWAWALPTGMGKTRSITAWLWAVNNLGLNDISVIITASKVEALCRLKRDLLEAGVPEQKVGLVHSYKHDPEMAEAYKIGERKELTSGYASEPITEDNQDRPFLLLTHQRIKGKNGIEQYNVYKGRPRSLVVWDESLIVSDTFAFEDDRVRASWAWLREMDRVKTPERDEALVYLEDAIERIKKAMSLQQDDVERKPQAFTLAPLSGEDIERHKSALGSSEQAELLKDLLDISQEELRVLANVEQGGGVITFRVSVPRELENIVVLDASYPIRELSQLDPSIRQAEILKDIVSYDNVSIHQLDHASGRGAMEKEFSKRRGYNPVSREVADVIKGIPENEGVILFTFKGKGRLDYQKLLERDLEAEGIDTEAMIEVRMSNETQLKPRLNFLSWGNETSLSQYSYCSNVILVGIIHRSHIDIGGAIVGQTGNLLRPVSNGEIRDVVQSEVAHACYQALSRGACRVMQGSFTRPMKAWLIHPKRENLRGRLEQVMPGVKWGRWEPKYLVQPKATSGKAKPLAEKIRVYLRELPADPDKVSIKRLKADLDLGDIPPSTVQRAIRLVVERSGDWAICGRTLVKQCAFYFGKAEPKSDLESMHEADLEADLETVAGVQITSVQMVDGELEQKCAWDF